MSKEIALFVEDNYNELEFWYPFYRFQEAGYKVTIIGSGRRESYTGKSGALPVKEYFSADKVKAEQFAAVIVPGGYAPDLMRLSEPMVNLVREAYAQGKVVASICHGAWMLISAGIIKGKKATCCPHIKDDLKNAGAEYINQEVIVDGKIVTSRVPDDLPAFCKAVLSLLG
ncbi:type 1 glutamine amidotransferase domain-containing protein [Desulfolucanica intricata]|uniref:type 1 glutamine amidotransferase domain-containing protein n=1 Tax=Desulfolucanica intricata TaxID=1285191 RepID=UPI000829D260|nr:type 1 glutamine amidotransferase domain-containing protein [Desulfolucanica intricata]